ncbi:hypothetical protein PMIN02_002587 [Paraphaeosphaeria minitans]
MALFVHVDHHRYSCRLSLMSAITHVDHHSCQPSLMSTLTINNLHVPSWSTSSFGQLPSLVNYLLWSTTFFGQLPSLVNYLLWSTTFFDLLRLALCFGHTLLHLPVLLDNHHHLPPNRTESNRTVETLAVGYNVMDTGTGCSLRPQVPLRLDMDMVGQKTEELSGSPLALPNIYTQFCGGLGSGQSDWCCVWLGWRNCRRAFSAHVAGRVESEGFVPGLPATSHLRPLAALCPPMPGASTLWYGWIVESGLDIRLGNWVVLVVGVGYLWVIGAGCMSVIGVGYCSMASMHID